jgi:hypothetical protein
MQCILYKIYFWNVFHMYYNLICIFICTPIWTKKFILVKSGCYNGSEGSISFEHVSRYFAQLGMISVSDPLRVRFFSQSLTGPAFGWYTSLGTDSIRTWKRLEEQFHIQYHSEAAEVGIPDLAKPSRLLSSSSVARARTLSCSGGIGFMPNVASLLQCTNV